MVYLIIKSEEFFRGEDKHIYDFDLTKYKFVTKQHNQRFIPQSRLPNHTYLAVLNAQNKNLIVIAGPTAVGKTAVAIQLAQHFKTVVISADSRQVYREMNIGTAKPSPDELALVPHYFIDNLSITSNYDAAQYGREALAQVNTLFKHQDTVILCGGSGLYIKALCDGFDDIPDVPEEIRKELSDQYDQHGLSWLQQKLMELDPEHFKVIDQRNPHRLMRALEVKMGTGHSISFFRRNDKVEHSFSIIKVGLALDRALLYNQIDHRMDKMINEGLFEEAEKLYPFRSHNALQTVGYQEIFDYLEGKHDRDEAIRLLKRNSRRYAKRQLTWFKRDAEMRWFRPDEIDLILSFISASILKA
jgi:tRNA dimethylallyltransferase